MGMVTGMATPGFDDLDLAWLEAKPGAKWHRHGPGRLAAWVADMDFPAPPPVAAALHAFVDAGDLGYPDWPEETPMRALFAQRMADRFAWTASADHVRELCDVVQGVQIALHLATPPGSSIALHTPAYPPFFRTSATMDRPILPIPAARTGRRLGLRPRTVRRATSPRPTAGAARCCCATRRTRPATCSPVTSWPGLPVWRRSTIC